MARHLRKRRYGTGFRPLIRGFFFYSTPSALKVRGATAVSVPSFGDSFFISEDGHCCVVPFDSFRPLIRGFFFYTCGKGLLRYSPYEVSVPSFGDSFFMGNRCSLNGQILNGVSVPSFGDSFFMKNGLDYTEDLIVSVPSFGDSFFIKCLGCLRESRKQFPSPHSGILFL